MATEPIHTKFHDMSIVMRKFVPDTECFVLSLESSLVFLKVVERVLIIHKFFGVASGIRDIRSIRRYPRKYRSSDEHIRR